MSNVSEKSVHTYRIFLVIMAALVVLGGVLLFVARDPDRVPNTTATSTVPTTNGVLDAGDSDMQLIQRLVEMVLDDSRFEELFDLIPAGQRAGIDEDTFYRYVAILRSGIRGKITAFEAMSEDELNEFRTQIAANAPYYKGQMDQLSGYWIVYLTSTAREERFSVFLEKDESDRHQFSKQWVEDMLAIHSYATLYFDAISSNNTQALATMVHSETDSDINRKDKADRLIRFYRESVLGEYSGFRLLHARADAFVYEQGSVDYSRYGSYSPLQQQPPQSELGSTPPLTITTPPTTRQMSLIQPAPGTVKVDDPVPFDITTSDLVLYRGERPLLGLGEYVYSFELNIRFGTRTAYSYRSARSPFDPDQRIIQVLFDGLKVTLVGVVDEQASAFSGNVYNIEFDSDEFQTGKGIMVGDTTADILANYPFADLTDWQVRALTVDDRIDFDLHGSAIERIRIGRMADVLKEIIRTTRPDGPINP